MDEPKQPDEGKQETKAANTDITQPAAPPPQQPPAIPNTGGAGDNPQQPQPILVRLVGGDDLEPFEEQTLQIARETLAISRRTYWIAIFGFGAALAAACFVGVQVSEMTYQTQILASQSEGANAGTLMDEMNTRKQLAIAQQQSTAAEHQVAAITRQMRQDQRAWVVVEQNSKNKSPYWKDGDAPGASFSIRNIGKTTGVDFGTIARVQILPKATPPALTYPKVAGYDAVFSGLILPQTEVPFDIQRRKSEGGKGVLEPLITPEYNDLILGSKYMVIYGFVTYRDIFKVRHKTKYCFFFLAKGLQEAVAKQCADYNAIDNN